MTNMYKLTIVIPVCDMEDMILRTLESIPVRDDIEVIIVENGSKDNTLNVIKDFIKDKGNYKLFNYDQRIGCAQACNVGLDNATGEYVLQLDADDYLFTDQVNYILNKEMGADLVYFNLKVNNGDVWHLNADNCVGLPDHTSMIKRSFLGEQRMVIDPSDIHAIGHGYLMFQELLKKEHTSNFTDITAYYYNYPREGSVYWEATHKDK